MLAVIIGNRINELRMQKGLSQEKLALKAELDRTYISGVEQGRRNASLKSLEKIINALDVSFDEFFAKLDG